MEWSPRLAPLSLSLSLSLSLPLSLSSSAFPWLLDKAQRNSRVALVNLTLSLTVAEAPPRMDTTGLWRTGGGGGACSCLPLSGQATGFQWLKGNSNNWTSFYKGATALLLVSPEWCFSSLPSPHLGDSDTVWEELRQSCFIQSPAI